MQPSSSSRRSPRLFSQFPSLALLLMLYLSGVQCQEKPSIEVKLFDESVDFRSNVCDRQRLLNDGLVTIPDALRGLNVTVATWDHQNSPSQFNRKLFRLNEEGAIPALTYPGLFTILLDEVANRSGFQWRNSFAAILPPTETVSNYTWSDILYWQVEKFDISADWWVRTKERLAHGVGFPDGWYDANTIIAKKHEEEQIAFTPFSFLRPFSFEVWGLIGASVVFTGLVFALTERLSDDASGHELQDKVSGSIFLASTALLGQNSYSPHSGPSRVIIFSMLFWAVLVVSAYTANLTSYLLASRNPNKTEVLNFNDAISGRQSVCVEAGTAQHLTLQQYYPLLDMVLTGTGEILAGLRDGKCDIAAVDRAQFSANELEKSINPGCRMYTDGRIQFKRQAGFASRIDTGEEGKCTSLIVHVLDYHFMGMHLDGTIKKILDNHLKQISSQNCSATSDSSARGESQASSISNTEIGSLGIPDMAGIFIMHVSLTFFALIYAMFYHFIIHKRSARDLKCFPRPRKAPSTEKRSQFGERSSVSADGDDSERPSLMMPLANESSLGQRQRDAIPEQKIGEPTGAYFS